MAAAPRVALERGLPRSLPLGHFSECKMYNVPIRSFDGFKNLKSKFSTDCEIFADLVVISKGNKKFTDSGY